MMHIETAKSPKSVMQRIHDAIVELGVETGHAPKRLAISSCLISQLKDELIINGLWARYPDAPPLKHDLIIFGLPCYTIVEDNIIMVSL